MGKYFKFIGWLSLLAFLSGAIFDLIVLVGTLKYLEGVEKFVQILFFLLLLFVGPALSLLFISYGNHLNQSSYHYSYVPTAEPEPETAEISNNVITTKNDDKKIIDDDRVSFENDSLKIGVLNFNLKIQPCSNIEIDSSMVSFDINSNHFTVNFSSNKKAREFLEFLEKHK